MRGDILSLEQAKEALLFLRSIRYAAGLDYEVTEVTPIDDVDVAIVHWRHKEKTFALRIPFSYEEIEDLCANKTIVIKNSAIDIIVALGMPSLFPGWMIVYCLNLLYRRDRIELDDSVRKPINRYKALTNNQEYFEEQIPALLNHAQFLRDTAADDKVLFGEIGQYCQGVRKHMPVFDNNGKLLFETKEEALKYRRSLI